MTENMINKTPTAAKTAAKIKAFGTPIFLSPEKEKKSEWFPLLRKMIKFVFTVTNFHLLIWYTTTHAQQSDLKC